MSTTFIHLHMYTNSSHIPNIKSWACRKNSQDYQFFSIIMHFSQSSLITPKISKHKISTNGYLLCFRWKFGSKTGGWSGSGARRRSRRPKPRTTLTSEAATRRAAPARRLRPWWPKRRPPWWRPVTRAVAAAAPPDSRSRLRRVWRRCWGRSSTAEAWRRPASPSTTTTPDWVCPRSRRRPSTGHTSCDMRPRPPPVQIRSDTTFLFFVSDFEWQVRAERRDRPRVAFFSSNLGFVEQTITMSLILMNREIKFGNSAYYNDLMNYSIVHLKKKIGVSK